MDFDATKIEALNVALPDGAMGEISLARPANLGVFSPREGKIVQIVLKSHSSLSISLTLEIAVPTAKTHRKNAYAKLGINSQQQLFNAFPRWQEIASSDT